MGVDYKHCPYCGQETYGKDARYCPSCGKPYPNINIFSDNWDKNNHSEEVRTECPLGLSKFNWGAFLFSWLWAIFNGMPWMILYILFVAIMVSLEDIVHANSRLWLILVRVIFGLTLSIVFGIFGNRWAWKHKKWKSIQHFESVQSRWKHWAFIYAGILLLLLWFKLFN